MSSLSRLLSVGDSISSLWWYVHVGISAYGLWSYRNRSWLEEQWLWLWEQWFHTLLTATVMIAATFSLFRKPSVPRLHTHKSQFWRKHAEMTRSTFGVINVAAFRFIWKMCIHRFLCVLPKFKSYINFVVTLLWELHIIKKNYYSGYSVESIFQLVL